jgi:hypothetical protein
MKLEVGMKESPLKIEKTERPWGDFLLYADNRKCTVKVLRVKKGEMLSLQYHFLREQLYVLLSDDFFIDYSNKAVSQEIADNPDDAFRIAYFEKFLKENMVTVKAGKWDSFYFKKRIIHRACYTGKEEYGIFLDVAFGTNIESDIVRVQDIYDRQPVLT